jgi:hypothetical protein
MRKYWPSISALVLVVLAYVALPVHLRAQGAFEVVTGKDFDAALPKDFYLEGNAIPTQKRNAALVKTPAGARVLFALIDTTGYSSQIQQKYEGMLITEGSLTLGGHQLGVGSYGFGYTKPAATSSEDAKLFLYNQAGQKVGECTAKKDTKIAQPKPLQVVTPMGEPARFYFGRYWVELK